MDVTVSSRNVDLSAALRAAAMEKIGRLDRFLEGMQRAEVHFFEERNPRIVDKDVCEVTIEGHGHHVRAKVAAPDAMAAVDAVASKLEHQLHKLKTKLVGRSHPRRASVNGSAPGSVLFEASDAEQDGPRIVRTKSFTMKPMTPEEAAMQLQLLGHSFYFFSNTETSRCAVIYRRRAGDLGLIDEAG